MQHFGPRLKDNIPITDLKNDSVVKKYTEIM